MEIQYKKYHLEIIATNEQETNLKKRLLAEGLAIGIEPFNLIKYQEADELQANEIQTFPQSHYESGGMQIAMIIPLTSTCHFVGLTKICY